MTFEDINWAVVKLKKVVPNDFPGNNLNNVAQVLADTSPHPDPRVRIRQLPTAVPSLPTTFKNYVWQRRIYKGMVTTTISSARWLLLVGVIKMNTIRADLIEKQLWKRKAVDVMVEFELYSPVPWTGTLEIRFNSDTKTNTYPFAKVHSHCVSSVLMGS